ncbi:MAG: diguanylate cyclase domain-containing protein [Gammaproteobacteria bacterium]
MKILTPVRKVSLGLVLIMVSVVLGAELLGLVPSEHRGFLEARKMLCESLAVQFSNALGRGNSTLVRKTLEELVERDESILSAAIVTVNDRTLLETLEHDRHWRDVVGDESTATRVQVPLFKGGSQWGTVQVAFEELPLSSVPYSFGQPLLPLVVFMTLAGFLLILWFVKRTLKELDPSSVIPERVKSAFDTLAEGLVIIDEKENIILANRSFCEKIDKDAAELVGHSLSRLDWQTEGGKYSWKIALAENARQTGALLRFKAKRSGATRTFTVNTTPISTNEGKVRGALATFNDLTDLERKQVELRNTVEALQTSRKELQEKAVELEFLATRDPLTSCLNRRSFFDKADLLFADASQRHRSLACIMCDIDHFKSINDNHGHAMGDKVIQLMATELRGNARPDDIVGRYGGEEFCLMLPGVELDAAAAVADRLRTTIKDVAHRSFDGKIRVTASFGVSVWSPEVESPADLISLADRALYVAKENGRNRVVPWRGEETEGLENSAVEAAQEDAPEPAQESELADGAADEAAPALRAAATAPVSAEGKELERLRERVSELETQLLDTEQLRSDSMGHDSVTGLPNRQLLMDRIRQATAHNQRFDRVAAVIVIDIDLFRRINDALGFVIGDKVLRKAGDRLLEAVRDSDTVAVVGSLPDAEGETATVSRTGADEFAIVLTDFKDADAVTWVVKRMLDELSRPINIDGNEIFISSSAGISLFPHDSEDADELLRQASAARYNAKTRLGRNNFAFFSDDLNHVSYRHIWLEGQIHNALENGEFALHYQPKVCLRTGRITGMEGLLRWTSPQIGVVSPIDFIPVAEHTGLINELGRWVIETGCAQAARWAAAGFDDVGVALNLSPLQFRQSDLPEQIMHALTAAHLAPGQLELEVTESVVMDNFDEAVASLARLAEGGVNIAVDDFGTGHSSLAYLKHLPVHTLKIDRSFLSDTVPDEQDKLIITAIVAMAHSMNLRVVAEGVETEAQQRFLSQLACDEMQGYFFSKPVPADATLDLLREHNGGGAGRKIA